MTTETVVINKPSTVAEPEGHQAAMIAKVDGTSGTPTDESPARPAWLPEKFKTVEDMAAAYAELETKQSQGTTTEPPKTETPPADPAATPESKAADELKKSGLDMAEFSDEFNKSGALSEASYQKLLAAGYDKTLVDNYINGQRAVAAQYDQTILTAAGGQEAYSEMVAWAKVGMTEAEQTAYNEAVSSGDIARAQLAVAGLQSKFASDNGREPSLLGGRTNSAPVDAYESLAQLTEAMKDPRYQKDPAYRNAVQAKLGRSNIM